MCGHLHMEYCGSGGCRSHIVFDDLVYDIRGQLFLLVPEPSYEGASTGSTLSAVIAWWGSASSCHSQADEETDPAHLVSPNNCLLTAQYNRIADRLMFQNDHRPWPVKWSCKTVQRAKMYPTLKTGYKNDQETQFFGQV